MSKLNPDMQTITAFAPATSANLGVGFDILGLALSGIGDSVTVTRRTAKGIGIEKINSAVGLPLSTAQNTAAHALQQMHQALGLTCGFALTIDKGIAIGSGMGGSAASAVAAVVALNGFLQQPLTKTQLLNYALAGEEVASGARHADNVAPCLYGGITLIRSLKPIDIISLPYPALYCVIVHPQLRVETKAARQMLTPNITLKQHVEQSAQLSATIYALCLKDVALLQRSMQDLIIEPQRAHLVTGYYAVKQAALNHGAISATLSGSGPSLLALCHDLVQANDVAQAMQAAFKQQDISAEYWVAPINPHGAQIVAINQ